MKRIPLVVLLSVALVGGLALAAVPWTNINLNQWVKSTFYVGPAATVGTTGNHVKKMLGGSATIDFASAYSGVELSSGITVTGAAVGDPCFVGVPSAAAALKAKFGCYVSATDTVKVWFSPENVMDGTAQFASATPSTVTVDAGVTGNDAICHCTPIGDTAAISDKGCATSVAYPTLTMTGPDSVTTIVSYQCKSPVNPASGTYYVRVISSQ